MIDQEFLGTETCKPPLLRIPVQGYTFIMGDIIKNLYLDTDVQLR